MISRLKWSKAALRENASEVEISPSSSSTPMASSSKQKIGVKGSESDIEAKEKALSAFRTITTMLSLIQSTRGFAGDLPKLQSQPKALLNLLNAFATVLLRNQGVIAVTARNYDGSGKVEVLASYAGTIGESLIISQPSAADRIVNALRNVFISQNARDSTVRRQEVVDPETSVPDYLKGIKDPSVLLTTFLTCIWPSLTRKGVMDSTSSFEIHSWMIARLIEMSGSSNICLSHYVIAVCYERMITRMKYRISTSLYDALKNLPPTFKFPTQFPLIHASNRNDKRFIKELKKLVELRTPIEKLVKHEDDLYSQETYVDFHKILYELLELFLNSLERLKKTHDGLDGKAPDMEVLIKQIEFIAKVAGLLRLLVKSQAIKRCLHSIVAFLPDRAASVKTKVDNKTDVVDVDDEQDQNNEEDSLYRVGADEDEDELGLVGQEGSDSIELQPKSRACFRLLNLAIVYVDAILTLSNFVMDENKNSGDNLNIKIKILRLPVISQSMLPWRTLLLNDTYFPGKPSPSANDIVQFLESLASGTGDQRSGSSQNTIDNKKSKDQKSTNKSQKSNELPVSTKASPESISKSLKDLPRLINESNAKAFSTQITEAIRLLRTLQYGETSMKYIEIIIKKLTGVGLKALSYETIPRDDSDIDDILEMLRTLANNTKLERMLRKGSPLDIGGDFKGRFHAEACVAAYCTFTEPEWFQPFTIRAAGVSKLCCPVCGFVLKSIEPSFIFTATHNTISPCSLPPNLSLKVINAAVAQFGTQLREELGQLMQRTDVVSSCDDSINSQDLSVESFGSNYLISSRSE